MANPDVILRELFGKFAIDPCFENFMGVDEMNTREAKEILSEFYDRLISVLYCHDDMGKEESIEACVLQWAIGYILKLLETERNEGEKDNENFSSHLQ